MTKQPPDASRGSRPSRKFLWLAMTIVLVVGAYSAGWFAVAGQLDQRLPLLLRQAASQGVQSECKDAAVLGYPMNMGISCQSTVVDLDRQNIKIISGKFSSVAPVYNPRRIISDFEGPVIVTGQQDLAIHIDWETLQTDTTIAKNGLKRGTTEGKRVSVSVDGQNLPLRFNADIGHFLAQVTRQDADLNLEVEAQDFVSPVALDASSFSIEATIVGGAQLTDFGSAPSLRGKTINLRTLNAKLTDGGEIELSGKLDIASDGRANGDLRIRMANVQAVGAALGELLPDLGKQINQFGPALTALDIAPDDGPDAVTLPLSLRNSNISIGLLPLGTLPLFK